MNVFKQVPVDTYNVDNDNSLIEAYTKHPENMEQLTLIEAAKYWSYDKHRWGKMVTMKKFIYCTCIS